MLVSGALRASVASLSDVWEAHGIKLVIRDMDNGVLRLECWDLVPVSVVEGVAKAAGSAGLTFPVPWHYEDLILEAIARLGVARPGGHVLAYARSVGEYVIELVATFR